MMGKWGGDLQYLGLVLVALWTEVRYFYRLDSWPSMGMTRPVEITSLEVQEVVH
jgi:hypothetical protein